MVPTSSSICYGELEIIIHIKCTVLVGLSTKIEFIAFLFYHASVSRGRLFLAQKYVLIFCLRLWLYLRLWFGKIDECCSLEVV